MHSFAELAQKPGYHDDVAWLRGVGPCSALRRGIFNLNGLSTNDKLYRFGVYTRASDGLGRAHVSWPKSQKIGRYRILQAIYKLISVVFLRS